MKKGIEEIKEKILNDELAILVLDVDGLRLVEELFNIKRNNRGLFVRSNYDNEIRFYQSGLSHGKDFIDTDDLREILKNNQ